MPDWHPFSGLELTLEDGRRLRVTDVDFVVDDHPGAAPRRWKLTALSARNIQQLTRMGYAKLVEG